MKWYRTIPVAGWLLRRANPSSDDVVAFWAAMQDRFGSEVMDKGSASEMRLVAEFLDLLGVIRSRDFMSRYTTTFGSRIYVPFQIGEASRSWPLWAQIVVCVHEHVHVVQDRSAGGLAFAWDYVTSPAARTQYEVEAYTTGLALEHRYRGSIPNPRIYADLLLNYGCSLADVEVAEKAMRLQLPAIRRGALPGPVLQWAVPWLDARWRW